jgi:hypothetical protein
VARTSGFLKVVERLADRLGNTGRALLLFVLLFGIGLSYHTAVLQPQLDELARQVRQCDDDLKACFLQFVDSLEAHSSTPSAPVEPKDPAPTDTASRL